MLQKEVFNSMPIESARLAGRKSIEVSYEVIVMRFIPKKLIKLLSSDDEKKRVIMSDGIHTLAYGHASLKKIVIKNELQWDTKYVSW